MKLYNTIWKLTRNKSLTVVYFGGSITEGGGEYGWRGLATSWLCAQYPQADIREVNAAIGGTGTQLGVYRCDKDVISYEPDLVFIEFALNDRAESDCDEVRCNTESIVRKLIAHNPYIDIVEVFTTSKSIEDYIAKGGIHQGRKAHGEVAVHYSLPEVINIGTPLAQAVHAAGGDWLKYTRDTVHPNEEGYRIYGDFVIEKMKTLLDVQPPQNIKPRALPEQLSPYLVEDARMVDTWDVVQNKNVQPDTRGDHDWGRLMLDLCGRYPHTTGASRPGAELVFSFEGTAVGIYAMIASDSGDLEYRIDVGKWQKLSTWDEYALKYSRAGFFMLADHIEGTGPHELTLRVSEHKNEQSTGNWIRIGAFGVG